MNKSGKMHWLKKWRRAHKLSREAFAAMVRVKDFSERRPGTGCSERLIEILEDEKGVTHPKIAARIAQVTGATLAEYESIIPEIHRNGKLPKAAAGRKRKQKPEPKPAKADGRGGNNARAVVKIDADGVEIGRFARLIDAAAEAGCANSHIRDCCTRQVKRGNDFRRHGCTWRYAEEWDAMTVEERKRDMGVNGQ